MAGQNYIWQVSSPNIGNGEGVISSAYNVDGKSPFTTITANNPTGYINVFPNSTSTDLNIKNLQYAIQTDGKITYRVLDGTDNPRQYNSLQELADGRGSWRTSATTQVKIQINGILTTSAQSNGITPTSPTPSARDPQSGETPEQVQSGLTSFKQGDLQQAIGDGGYRKSYTGGVRGGNFYIYPIDMSDKQDRVKFTMYRYSPKKIDVSNISPTTASIFSGGNVGTKLGTVYLPIQPTIQDSNSVEWGPDTLNSLEAIAATASYGTIQGGGEALIDALKGVSDLISKGNKDIKAALAAAATGAAINKSFLTRATGGILNPNMELLFNGPQLRNFTFTFDMSAREPKEAEEIRRIIRFFKQGMSAKRASSYLFLKSPNVFDIAYEQGTGKEHPWINKIKTCALQNCVVNYTPAGNYATYDDGAMTQYNMSLTFGEIDPIYDDDYEKGEDKTTMIGY